MAKRNKRKYRHTLKYTLAHLFKPRRSNNHRARVLHPDVTLYFCLIILGFFALVQTVNYFPMVKGSVLGFVSTITPSQVIDYTNLEREKAGFEPLVINPQLNQAALAKAQDMFNDQYWAHTAPDGIEPWDFIEDSGYVYKLAGENLARDFANTKEMVAAWMASPTHRANIMNSNYTEIGIAVVDGRLQGFDTTLVVQMFGKPRLVKAGVPNSSDQVTLETQVPTSEEKVVLAGVSLPRGSLVSPPLFTPLQLTKAFFLAVIMMILMTLAYDTLVIGHKATLRLVGNNFAHIIFLFTLAFLVIFFKGGFIDQGIFVNN